MGPSAPLGKMDSPGACHLVVLVKHSRFYDLAFLLTHKIEFYAGLCQYSFLVLLMLTLEQWKS